MSVSKREQIYNKSKNRNKLTACDLSQRMIRLCQVKQQTETSPRCKEEHLDMAFAAASSLHSIFLASHVIHRQIRHMVDSESSLGCKRACGALMKAKEQIPGRALIPVRALRSP